MFSAILEITCFMFLNFHFGHCLELEILELHMHFEFFNPREEEGYALFSDFSTFHVLDMWRKESKSEEKTSKS